MTPLQRCLLLLGCPPYRPVGSGRANSDYGKAHHPARGAGSTAKPVDHIADRDRAEEAGREPGERDALAFFCDANIDWPIAAVPTCDYVGGDARLALLAVIRVPATPPRRQRQSQ